MTEKLIFISHRSSNKAFADILVDFFAICGIPSDQIFCSSLPGNDIQQGISKEIKAAIKASKIDIVILSDEYYDSIYCQNEVGIIWYKDDTDKIAICLPEINEYAMLGFFDKENKIRRLDMKNDIYTICDIIKPYFSGFITSTAKLSETIDKLMNSYKREIQRRKIVIDTMKTPNSANLLESKIMNDDLNDDELIIVKYVHDTQNNTIDEDYEVLKKWLKEEGINKQIGESPEALLVEENLMEYLTFGMWDNQNIRFRVDVYRELRKLSDACISFIDHKLSKYKPSVQNELACNDIDALIQNEFSDEEILLIKYIMDVEKECLKTGWQTDIEERAISIWEEMYHMDDTLRQNYSKALIKFNMRKYLDVSATTSYNNPKEFKINEKVMNMIKNLNDASKRKLSEITIKYQVSDDLPF